MNTCSAASWNRTTAGETDEFAADVSRLVASAGEHQVALAFPRETGRRQGHIHGARLGGGSGDISAAEAVELNWRALG